MVIGADERLSAEDDVLVNSWKAFDDLESSVVVVIVVVVVVIVVDVGVT